MFSGYWSVATFLKSLVVSSQFLLSSLSTSPCLSLIFSRSSRSKPRPSVKCSQSFPVPRSVRPLTRMVLRCSGRGMQGEGEGEEGEVSPNWDRSGGCSLSANFSTLVKVSELQNYNFIRRQTLNYSR